MRMRGVRSLRYSRSRPTAARGTSRSFRQRRPGSWMPDTDVGSWRVTFARVSSLANRLRPARCASLTNSVIFSPTDHRSVPHTADAIVEDYAKGPAWPRTPARSRGEAGLVTTMTSYAASGACRAGSGDDRYADQHDFQLGRPRPGPSRCCQYTLRQCSSISSNISWYVSLTMSIHPVAPTNARTTGQLTSDPQLRGYVQKSLV